MQDPLLYALLHAEQALGIVAKPGDSEGQEPKPKFETVIGT